MKLIYLFLSLCLFSLIHAQEASITDQDQSVFVSYNQINEEISCFKCSSILWTIDGEQVSAYKKDVDDYRESPSIIIIKELHKAGSLISYSDPFIEECSLIKDFLVNDKSIKISKDVLLDFDLAILLTDHSNYDYEMISNFSNLIVDTRGKFIKSDKVFPA